MSVLNSLIDDNSQCGIAVVNEGNLRIANTTITKNPDKGISLEKGDSSKITDSTFSNNGRGIYLSNTRQCIIARNTFQNNVNQGVIVESGSIQNVINKNNFINNGNPQATCIPSNNEWSSGNVGNYWSDWTTPDVNKDLIVDNPYLIDGDGSTQDDFPLAIPYGIPKIMTPNDLYVDEDEYYFVSYQAKDFSTPSSLLDWTYDSNADWLSFSAPAVISGTPENEDVGDYWVNLIVSNGLVIDETNFTLKVNNTNDNPIINGTDIKFCEEDQLYYTDYNATDEDPTNDQLSWTLNTNANFLGSLTDRIGHDAINTGNSQQTGHNSKCIVR